MGKSHSIVRIGTIALIGFAIISGMLAMSCSTDKLPEFNQKRSYDYLVKQCDFGPRVPNSPEIGFCREYIKNQLRTCNAEVEEQRFTMIVGGVTYEGVNIIAHFYPDFTRRMMLGAHYDSRPWADEEKDLAKQKMPVMGANDGASGVAVLLEIANILHQQRPKEIGVDMVFFDMEDLGMKGQDTNWCLGSKYYIDHYKGDPPEKAIIIDMIGSKGLQIPMEGYSYQNCPTLLNEIWDNAKKLEIKEYQHQVSNFIYDDHIPLLQAGWNAVDLINIQYPYWHTTQDTPDKCSSTSLYAIGQVLVSLLY